MAATHHVTPPSRRASAQVALLGLVVLCVVVLVVLAILSLAGWL